MKKLLVLLLLLGSFLSYGQVNLVPNFSFEINTDCPSLGDQIEFADGWSKYSSIPTTPDYYNSCSAPNEMGVPQSFSLYQLDRRGCGAFAGMGLWAATASNVREHIGIQLNQPLVVGQKYFLSFYTVMGGTNDGTFFYECASNNIGMRLSTIPFNSANPVPIDNYAHLVSTAIINDTANWVRVSGSIIADSAYEYLALGNFYDDLNTDTMNFNCGNCMNNYSYNLVDDVCISTDSLLCNGGIDLLPCNVSVPEYDLTEHFNVYPNPAQSYIAIRNEQNLSYDLIITNSLGQLLYLEFNLNSDNIELDISSFDSGLLFVIIQSQHNQHIYKIQKK